MRRPIPDGFGVKYRRAVFAERPTVAAVRLAWVLLDEAYRAGDHRGAGDLVSTSSPCPECGIGGGRHTADCLSGGDAS
jgi:hypothetical protein